MIFSLFLSTVSSAYAYVWLLSPGPTSAQYASGIRAAVLSLRSDNAESLYSIRWCEFEAVSVDYILIRPIVQDIEFNYIVSGITPLFDHVVATPTALGAHGYYYADHYAKLFLLGFYKGGPLGLHYDRVMYLEADYMPLRSLTHLFVQEPSSNIPTQGPNPEWSPVTKTEKMDLQNELAKAKQFKQGVANCDGLWKPQVIPVEELERQRAIDAAGFIAMPTAYWIEQPCYTAGGPLLLTPSEVLYNIYTIPVTHCDESRQISFRSGQICNHPTNFKGICNENEMGYLNRILLQHDRVLARTLHPFYTVLKNEFIYQPAPNSNMKGYWTRNYFNNNESETFHSLFGVHFAGPIKAWHSPPHHAWGRPMTELAVLVRQFNRFQNLIQRDRL